MSFFDTGLAQAIGQGLSLGADRLRFDEAVRQAKEREAHIMRALAVEEAREQAARQAHIGLYRRFNPPRFVSGGLGPPSGNAGDPAGMQVLDPQYQQEEAQFAGAPSDVRSQILKVLESDAIARQKQAQQEQQQRQFAEEIEREFGPEMGAKILQFNLMQQAGVPAADRGSMLGIGGQAAAASPLDFDTAGYVAQRAPQLIAAGVPAERAQQIAMAEALQGGGFASDTTIRQGLGMGANDGQVAFFKWNADKAAAAYNAILRSPVPDPAAVERLRKEAEDAARLYREAVQGAPPPPPPPPPQSTGHEALGLQVGRREDGREFAYSPGGFPNPGGSAGGVTRPGVLDAHERGGRTLEFDERMMDTAVQAAIDAGHRPGTPEFRRAVEQALQRVRR